MAKRVATLSERIQINDLLKERLEPCGSGWAYKGDWDDGKVALLVAPDLNLHHVATVRKEMFGNLESPGVSKDSPETIERIAKLEAALADLTDRHNRLILSLTTNRVLDVRHLKTTDAPPLLS